ncbi:MAG: 2-oxoglutarate ferredoxin oxidoreductase subunit gamma [Clostridia bacterium]|nr:oorC [Clostridiales bacterium]MDK2985794.1 2-oxoglutarate ferredoxin oxidoreductase subunit gamma [Clostridia bacterium]
MAKGVKIALAGEGGQGVQSVAMILTEAAYAMGKEALYIPNFGVEQRGGVSVAFVQIDDEKIGSPKFKTADIVVALSDRAVRRTTMYCDQETLFFYDDNIEDVEEDLPKNSKKVVALPAIKVAKEELHPRVFNVVVMGAVIGATGVVTEEKAKEALESKLGYKFEQNPELREMNFKALQRGMEIVKEVM